MKKTYIKPVVEGSSFFQENLLKAGSVNNGGGNTPSSENIGIDDDGESEEDDEAFAKQFSLDSFDDSWE